MLPQITLRYGFVGASILGREKSAAAYRNGRFSCRGAA
jgi:hypothetical protein